MKRTSYIMYILTVLLLAASCSSNKLIKEEEPKGTESTDPMRFAAPNDNEQTPTKASALEQGFLVSCWKAFGAPGQHVVMDKYEVIYEHNDWYNSSKWGYVSDGSHSFYQTQYERYWDYSNFPYRFYAISPCPEYSKIGNFTLNEKKLVIPTSEQFAYQTSVDGLLVGGAEPYMPAQVSRETTGRDYDLMVKAEDGVFQKEINTGSQTLNRSVSMPFHHFTSKVRFGFYCTDLGTPVDIEIYDIKVEVISSGFTTAARGYEADLSAGSMITGKFLERTKNAAVEPLLVLTNDATDANKLSKCLSRSTAYWAKCKEGTLQIPQTGVRMRVSFKVTGKMIDDVVIDAYGGRISYDAGTGVTTYSNLVISPKMEDGTVVDTFDWEENNIYTYYITVSRYFLLPIEFTATLTPWEDVSGSLETDLEK